MILQKTLSNKTDTLSYKTELHFESTHSYHFISGCGFYKSGKCSICIHAYKGTGRWRRNQGIGAAGLCSNVSIFIIFLYGQ